MPMSQLVKELNTFVRPAELREVLRPSGPCALPDVRAWLSYSSSAPRATGRESCQKKRHRDNSRTCGHHYSHYRSFLAWEESPASMGPAVHRAVQGNGHSQPLQSNSTGCLTLRPCKMFVAVSSRAALVRDVSVGQYGAFRRPQNQSTTKVCIPLARNELGSGRQRQHKRSCCSTTLPRSVCRCWELRNVTYRVLYSAPNKVARSSAWGSSRPVPLASEIIRSELTATS